LTVKAVEDLANQLKNDTDMASDFTYITEMLKDAEKGLADAMLKKVKPTALEALQKEFPTVSAEVKKKCDQSALTQATQFLEKVTQAVEDAKEIKKVRKELKPKFVKISDGLKELNTDMRSASKGKKKKYRGKLWQDFKRVVEASQSEERGTVDGAKTQLKDIAQP